MRVWQGALVANQGEIRVMRALQLVAIATVSIAIPIAAEAQSTPAQPSTAAATTTTTIPSPENQWIASGFAGSNFANNADPSSPAFGGSIGYLWQGKWGGEFDASFTPDFGLQSNFFGLGIKPMVNTYMANAVAAMPFGPDRRWQPFIAGGVGAISLRSSLSTADVGSAIDNTFSPDATRFGGDIGGGVMGFMGNWGFKADLQYFRTTGQYQTSASQTVVTTGGTTVSGTTTPGTTTPGTGGNPPTTGPYVARDTTTSSSSPSSLSDAVLSGLHFWRANIGVALRW
jgi:outer membrane protein with beta-barrel domain